MAESGSEDMALQVQSAYAALCALNEELDRQLREEDIESLDTLLERRAAAIATLVSLHEHSPLPLHMRRDLMQGEEARQERVSALKEQYGSDLRKLHRQIRASSHYAKKDLSH